MYPKIITLDALIFIHGTMLLFVLPFSLNFMCFYQSLHIQSSNTFFSTPIIMTEFVAMLQQQKLIIYLAEKHSCFLSVDTVRCSVIFSLLQCNFLDSAVVAQLSAFLAVFSFPLIRVSVCICCCLLQASQLHCVAATFANTLCCFRRF